MKIGTDLSRHEILAFKDIRFQLTKGGSFSSPQVYHDYNLLNPLDGFPCSNKPGYPFNF
jgi:hypothetical protein